MLTVTAMLFLLPFSLLCATSIRWARTPREETPPRWRTYAGACALVGAACATLLTLFFFFSWFQSGGSPHGMTPAPGLWRVLGRTAIRAFVASMVLCAAGKGKWRLMFLGWVLSLAFVVPVIFMLEMQ